MSAIDQLMDTVDRIGFEQPIDFVDDAETLLALALSKLDEEARETVLFFLEGGLLRKKIKCFLETGQRQAAQGNGRLH